VQFKTVQGTALGANFSIWYLWMKLVKVCRAPRLIYWSPF